MSEEIKNTPEVVISAEGPFNPVRKRRKKKPRVKKLPDFPFESSNKEEPPSQTWFTAIANLAILIAIFTIIFAAHHAFKRNKMTANSSDQQEIAAATTTTVSASISDAPANDTAANNIKEEPQEVTEKPSEPVVPTVETKAEKPKAVAKKSRQSDPYTNGGPLDLDRTSVNAVNIEKAFSDDKNPWNSGGALDLDSSTAREQYKKNYLSSNESDR